AGRGDPFAPRSLRALPHYYESLRPCAPPRYSPPCVSALEVLPLHRGDRFTRSTLKPELGSRRLYAGRHGVGKWVASPLLPSLSPCSVLTSVLFLTTGPQRFACARLPSSYLPGLLRTYTPTLTTLSLKQ